MLLALSPVHEPAHQPSLLSRCPLATHFAQHAAGPQLRRTAKGNTCGPSRPLSRVSVAAAWAGVKALAMRLRTAGRWPYHTIYRVHLLRRVSPAAAASLSLPIAAGDSMPLWLAR